MTDLERSNAELRAVLILAGQQIRKLNFGKKNTALLRLMRRTLREARGAAGIEIRNRPSRRALPRTGAHIKEITRSADFDHAAA